MAKREFRDLSTFLTEFEVLVRPEDAGQRLDRFLRARVFWRSRTNIVERLRDGLILLNGASARKSTQVRSGDRIRLVVDPPSNVVRLPSEIGLRILHEDDDILVIDKDAGLLCHPVGRHVYDTLVNALHHRYRRTGDPDEDVVPRLAHRLDRDTTGVLLVTKSRGARAFLQWQFEHHRVEKEYVALVAGNPAAEGGEIDAPLGHDPHSRIRLKMAAVKDGLPSRTAWRVEERFRSFALLRLFPKTGRQHQIRAHLEHLGHPVLADDIYGRGDPVRAGELDPSDPGPDRVILGRQALHAERLSFYHPSTRARMTVTAPLPGDMAAVMEAARRGAGVLLG